MRIIGIDIAGSEARLIAWETEESHAIVLKPPKILFPTLEPTEGGNLARLKQVFRARFETERAEHIAIVATPADAGPLRAKIEAIARLAAYELDIPCSHCTPQKIAVRLRKATVPNDVRNVSPKYLLKATCCAWIVASDK